MIGYLSGKFLAAEDGGILVDVAGVGYSVLVGSRVSAGLAPGALVEIFVHTNVRENAIDLFGFSSLWEKKVFQTLISVSGVGPKTALAVLNGLDAEVVLSAIMREDRATLTSVSGVGKKTAEHMITDLAEKARKLLAERPRQAGARPMGQSVADAVTTENGDAQPSTKKGRSKAAYANTPPQGASASPLRSGGVDLADLWNEALAGLSNLGYRDADAISAIKVASTKISEAGETPSLEGLIRASLQLLSRGLMS
jgi:Holliday junction DNA helicase RuvA